MTREEEVARAAEDVGLLLQGPSHDPPAMYAFARWDPPGQAVTWRTVTPWMSFRRCEGWLAGYTVGIARVAELELAADRLASLMRSLDDGHVSGRGCTCPEHRMVAGWRR